MPPGVIVDATSDHLYYVVKFGGLDHCPPSCLPGCDAHGWYELASTAGRELVVRIRAVELSEPPDD